MAFFPKNGRERRYDDKVLQDNVPQEHAPDLQAVRSPPKSAEWKGLRSMTLPPHRSRTYRVIFAILLSCACVLIGFSMHEDMTAYESGNSDLSLNVLIMLAYDCFGKWGALAVWAIVAPLAIWLMCFARETE